MASSSLPLLLLLLIILSVLPGAESWIKISPCPGTTAEGAKREILDFIIIYSAVAAGRCGWKFSVLLPSQLIVAVDFEWIESVENSVDSYQSVRIDVWGFNHGCADVGASPFHCGCEM